MQHGAMCSGVISPFGVYRNFTVEDLGSPGRGHFFLNIFLSGFRELKAEQHIKKSVWFLLV
jgi:hypothetical protein